MKFWFCSETPFIYFTDHEYTAALQCCKLYFIFDHLANLAHNATNPISPGKLCIVKSHNSLTTVFCPTVITLDTSTFLCILNHVWFKFSVNVIEKVLLFDFRTHLSRLQIHNIQQLVLEFLVPIDKYVTSNYLSMLKTHTKMYSSPDY